MPSSLMGRGAGEEDGASHDSGRRVREARVEWRDEKGGLV